MEWYLVKYKDFSLYCEKQEELLINYFGLSGNIWPITGFDSYKNKFSEIIECYRSIEKGMEYLELDSESYIHVSTDLELICKYSTLLEKEFCKKPIVLSVSNDLERVCDGYDFGNPEGGYSIIASEILNNDILYKQYLNSNGLFDSFISFRKFMESINSDKVEELDEYYLLSIKIMKF